MEDFETTNRVDGQEPPRTPRARSRRTGASSTPKMNASTREAHIDAANQRRTRSTLRTGTDTVSKASFGKPYTLPKASATRIKAATRTPKAKTPPTDSNVCAPVQVCTRSALPVEIGPGLGNSYGQPHTPPKASPTTSLDSRIRPHRSSTSVYVLLSMQGLTPPQIRSKLLRGTHGDTRRIIWPRKD